MDFIKFIETIPNITIAKRVASAYVADYRRLELDELKVFLKKRLNNIHLLRISATDWKKSSLIQIAQCGLLRQYY